MTSLNPQPVLQLLNSIQLLLRSGNNVIAQLTTEPVQFLPSSCVITNNPNTINDVNLAVRALSTVQTTAFTTNPSPVAPMQLDPSRPNSQRNSPERNNDYFSRQNDNDTRNPAEYEPGEHSRDYTDPADLRHSDRRNNSHAYQSQPLPRFDPSNPRDIDKPLNPNYHLQMNGEHQRRSSDFRVKDTVWQPQNVQTKPRYEKSDRQIQSDWNQIDNQVNSDSEDSLVAACNSSKRIKTEAMQSASSSNANANANANTNVNSHTNRNQYRGWDTNPPSWHEALTPLQIRESEMAEYMHWAARLATSDRADRYELPEFIVPTLNSRKYNAPLARAALCHFLLYLTGYFRDAIRQFIDFPYSVYQMDSRYIQLPDLYYDLPLIKIPNELMDAREAKRHIWTHGYWRYESIPCVEDRDVLVRV